MKHFLIIGVAALALTGCTTCKWEADQEVRREYFETCLALIPDGPESTTYNDWAEVVDTCDDTAYWQSKREVCTEY